MKKVLLLIIITGYAVVSYAQNSELNDYVNCLKGNSCDPVDYIFNLFEKADVVVIGERDHRDTTQYELILDILKDPRFVKKIGYVYTEIGCVNRTKEVNKLLRGTCKSDKAFNNALYAYLRTEDFNPLWDRASRRVLPQLRPICQRFKAIFLQLYNGISIQYI